MFRNNWKKIVITLVLITSTFILGGCSSEMQEFKDTTFAKQLESRINYNRDIIKKMEDKKVITSDTAKTYYDQLDKVEKQYIDKSDGIKLKSGAEYEMLNAVSKYRRLSRPADFSEYYSTDTNAKNNIDTLKFRIDGKYKKVSSLNDVVVTNMGVANNSNKNLQRFTYAGDASYNFPKNLVKTETSGGTVTFNTGINAQAQSVYASATPITLIDDTSNILVDYEIYTLDPTKATNYDSVLKAISSSVKDDGTIDKSGKNTLDKYFSSVKKSDGSNLMLSDLITSGELSGVSKEHNNNSSNKPGVDMRVKQDIYIQYLSGNTETTKTVSKNVMDIKLREFYSDEVDKMCKVLGFDSVTLQDSHKWVMYDGGKGKRVAFLIEYPVYYIQGLQDYGSDNNYSEAVVKRSPYLGVNLATKQMVRYTDSGSNEYRIISAENNEFYLLLDGSGDSSGTGKSSFFLSGIGCIDVMKSFNIPNDNFVVPTVRIILRDYLEAIYAPGSDSNQQGNGVVLFGRKIRFVNYLTNTTYKTSYDGMTTSEIKRRSDGNKEDTDEATNLGKKIEQTRILFNKSDNCACFVDINGNFISSTGKSVDITNKNSPDCLKVTDLCDIRELAFKAESDKTKKVISPTSGGEVEGEYAAKDNTNGDGIETGPENKRANDISGLSVVKTKKFVEISTPFPGNDIGKADYEQDNKTINGTKNGETMHQLFYAVATTADMFSTNLFDTWINVTTDQASLSWWHSWLKENDYLYALSDAEIQAYLYENYRYELSQEGVIILDLETVHKIQEEMDADKEVKSNQFFRTAFMVVGWALVIISIILVLAWFFDTNVDLGFQILSKITLGLWVPIKYKEDIPNSDAEGRKYMALSDILITALIMSAVGILLILVDVMDILVFLLGTFGIFAEKISQLLTGM